MRGALKTSLLAAVVAGYWVSGSAAEVSLDWLDRSAPALNCGVSFGVPWPEGSLKTNDPLSLAAADGRNIPLQTWPLAYWPDGSVKWSGIALSAGPRLSGTLKLSGGPSAAPATPLKAAQTGDFIEVNTGAADWRIARYGSALVDSVSMSGRVVARQGRLICIREDRSEYDTKRITREEDFTSRIDSAVLEQSGPVRAVVKLTGMHKFETSDRAWLPFTVRLYFYAGVDSVRLVHTFIFDGDQEQDFIRGLGVRFSVPMREQEHNRHVRLAGGTGGLFAEPVRLIAGRRDPSPALYAQQIAGQPVPNLESLRGRSNVEMMAVWDAYKLVQASADSFSIQKRTNPKSSWINAAAGKRSDGLAFVGDTTGGLAVGLKNFWQLAPTELEVEHASTDAAELTVWLWSPDVPAMDMRHYDIKEHGLEASYEDIDPGFSTATGVARTTELTLQPFTSVPADEELVKLAQLNAEPPHLVCTPEYYHSANVFGLWSLPDRSTPAKARVEDRLNCILDYYRNEVEDRHWYGFWDFGDVMHSYDPERHTWRYDVGGFAWDNSELMPDLWLWYSFLRGGRAETFRMAEAMTRQTQEVDVYHLGRFAGLGSRHNVRHWGCGAKEVRISQSILKRFYYYLTTDERTGDLMHEVTDVDYKLAEIDPLRKILPKSPYPAHARSGPDWLACAGNWMTEWERTGNTAYRDKIITGMKALAAMPRGLSTSLSYGYDPKTGMLYDVPDQRMDPTHFIVIFGGAETAFELGTLLNVPEWSGAWTDLCQRWGRNGDGGPRMAAYAAYAKNDPDYGRRAWRQLLDGMGSYNSPAGPVTVEGPNVPHPVQELAGSMGTGGTAQWCLNAIEVLELAGKYPPEETPQKSVEGN